jgi:hypothetical protein
MIERRQGKCLVERYAPPEACATDDFCVRWWGEGFWKIMRGVEKTA